MTATVWPDHELPTLTPTVRKTTWGFESQLGHCLVCTTDEAMLDEDLAWLRSLHAAGLFSHVTSTTSDSS